MELCCGRGRRRGWGRWVTGRGAFGASLSKGICILFPSTSAWAGTHRRDTSVKARRSETARRVMATCLRLALHFLSLFALSIVYLLSMKTKTGGREARAARERSSHKCSHRNWRAASSATLLVATPRQTDEEAPGTKLSNPHLTS